MRIDKLDTKILHILLKDSRTTFAKIANECKTSAEVIRVRYLNLKKHGVIHSEILEVLPSAIGINCFGHININTNEEFQQIAEVLNNKPYIIGTKIEKLENRIEAIFAAPNYDFMPKITKDLKIVKNIIAFDYKLFTDSPFFEYPENLVIKPINQNKNIDSNKIITHSKWTLGNNFSDKSFIQTSKLRNMNKTERNVAKILIQNSRISFAKLAETQNISSSQAKRIYLKLRKTLFKNQTITVDLQKLGYQATVDVLIKIRSGYNIDELTRKILKIPNIISLYKIVNIDGFYVGSPIKTLHGFFKIKENLLQLEEIKSAEYTISKLFQSWPTNIFSLFL